METLEDKIKKFLAIDVDSNVGISDGNVFDNNSGYGDNNGDVYGDGSGYGSGSGDGSGDGYGYGHGDGYGYGHGQSYGYGNGSSDGDVIKEIQGYKVYMVDNTPTIITSVHGNVAQGFILKSDLQLEPCYIIKENNKFAHGNTLRDAFTSLQEKLYDGSTEEERIEAFKQKFPSYDTKYDNRDLFTYHHVLTGSCRMGRETFVTNRGLSLDDKTTVREFIELTKNAYGGDIIKQLPQAYGIVD